MTTTSHPTTTRDGEAIDRFAADLLTGRVFARCAASADSRFGYQPPTRSDRYAKAMERLARMAGDGDFCATVAARIFGRVNLHGTDAQAISAVHRAAADYFAGGTFDDAIGRSGPEAGRHSDHQHPITERQAATVAVWLAYVVAPFDGQASIGWALAAVADRTGVQVAAIENRATR